MGEHIFPYGTNAVQIQRLQGLRIGRSDTFAGRVRGIASSEGRGACHRKGHICILPYSILTAKGVIHDNCMVFGEWGSGGPPPENCENLIFKCCSLGHF